MDTASFNLPHRGGDTPRGSTPVDGKRKRRPTLFAGFLTEDKQIDSLITANNPAEQQAADAGAAPDEDEGASLQEDRPGERAEEKMSEGAVAPVAPTPLAPGPEAIVSQPPVSPSSTPVPKRPKLGSIAVGRCRSTVSGKGGVLANTGGNNNNKCSISNNGGAMTTAVAYPSVKKVPGVQNATRKALEWLQHGDLTLVELAQHLPKLSKARVEIVMEALRAAGLVSLIRKHAPDFAGVDHITEVYRFSAGCSASEALEIGGGKPVSLGFISKRIEAATVELAALNQRIDVLKAEAAKQEPDPQSVLEILRHFMKHDKSLDEDPFYTVAYKATTTAAAKAAKEAAAARAAAKAVAEAAAVEKAAAAAKKAAETAAALEAKNAKLLAASLAAAAAATAKAASAKAAAIARAAGATAPAAAAGTTPPVTSAASGAEPAVVATTPVVAAVGETLPVSTDGSVAGDVAALG